MHYQGHNVLFFPEFQRQSDYKEATAPIHFGPGGELEWLAWTLAWTTLFPDLQSQWRCMISLSIGHYIPSEHFISLINVVCPFSFTISTSSRPNATVAVNVCASATDALLNNGCCLLKAYSAEKTSKNKCIVLKYPHCTSLAVLRFCKFLPNCFHTNCKPYQRLYEPLPCS